VAIVVVMYNSAALLPDLVASLPDGARGVDHELVLVDNASTDESVARARECAPWATIVETGRNGGYAAGINAGLASAGEHRAALVLNPDVRLQPGCLATLLAALDDPEVGIAVPRLEDRNGVLIFSMRREPSLRSALADALIGAERAGRIGTLGEVVSDPAAYAAPARPDWPEGSTMLVSRECLDAVGPWDESFFLYSEETEFALRSGDAGYATQYVPSARAVHLEGGSAGNPAAWALVVKNRVVLFRRRNGRLRGVLFWAVVTLREASRAVLGRRTSQAALRVLLSPSRMHEPSGPWSLAGGRPARTGPAVPVRRR
jgi:GT2 family glycosyltransferase